MTDFSETGGPPPGSRRRAMQDDEAAGRQEPPRRNPGGSVPVGPRRDRDNRSARDGRDRGPEGGGFLGLLREVVLVLVIALGLSLLIKTFLVQAFFIPSQSMESTLLVGDRVLVSKLTPGPFDLKRGDIVVFEDSGGWLKGEAAPDPVDEGAVRNGIRSALTFVGLLPASSDEHLIKRVIGLPGDRVECCDSQGRITVNGTPITEPYLYKGDKPSLDPFKVTVPAGRLWVMGDHRSVSADSRSHMKLPGGGTIPESDVVGRAVVLVWPINRFTVLHNPGATFAGVKGP